MSQDNTSGKTMHVLFDLQKFLTNGRLKSIADGVGRKYGLNGGRRELSDDEINVWAAGDWAAGCKPKKNPGETDE